MMVFVMCPKSDVYLYSLVRIIHNFAVLVFHPDITSDDKISPASASSVSVTLPSAPPELRSSGTVSCSPSNSRDVLQTEV